MTIPKFLYKYQPFKDKRVENVKQHKIWFSNPIRLNDPFDCNIRLGIEMSDQEIADLVPFFRKKLSHLSDFDARYLAHGIPNAKFKDAITNGAVQAFDEQRNKMLYERGVACFSEKKDDLLMWSHYADGHRGFCLEFDTAFDPFHKALQVQYSERIPSISPASVLLKGEGVLIPMITTKSDCWAYEKEWRIFHKEGNKLYGYDAKCLTGVYFGIAMRLTEKAEITNALRDSSTKIYQMSKSEDKFRVSCSPIYLAQ